MDVSIIIVNYNTCELLQNCLRSVVERTQQVFYEIIVVDNCSSDDSVSMVKNLFPLVKLVESKENLGFGKGNNLGSKYALGKYLFFLNSDTLLINNAVKILFNFLEDDINRNVACVGGNLYHSDGRPNYSYTTSFPSLLYIFLYRSYIGSFLGYDYFNKTGKPKVVSIIIGADLLISKEKFNLIDGFDPNYFMYVEEGDLQYRLKQRGFQSMSVPDAKIIHLQGASSPSAFKLKSEIQSYFLYFSKFFSRNTLFIYKQIELFFLWVKYIFFNIKDDEQKRKNYLEILKYVSKSLKQ